MQMALHDQFVCAMCKEAIVGQACVLDTGETLCLPCFNSLLEMLEHEDQNESSRLFGL